MTTANFQATTTDDSIPVQWYIEIEGIRRRYGTHEPSWNPADSGTNQHIQPYMESMPEIQGQVVNPLDGSTEYQTFAVELVDIDDELTSLFSIHDETNRAETTMTAAITAAGTDLTVADSSVFSNNSDIYVDRETMRITAIPDGTSLTVTRGMYNSEAVAHDLEDDHGNTIVVPVTDKPTYLYSREVLLCENREGLAEADSIKMRCYLESIEEPDPGVYRLSCAGFLRQLDREIGTTLQKLTLKFPLWGGLEEQEGASVARATMWMFLCNGDASNFQASGHVKIDEEIIEYHSRDAYTGASPFYLIDNTDTNWGYYTFVPTVAGRGCFSSEMYGARGLVAGNPANIPWMPFFIQPLLMDCHEPEAEVQEIIHSDKFTAGTDPASVILTLLTSTGNGTNGTYDVLPEGWGAGIDDDKIDVTGIENTCARSPLSSVDLAPFAITEAVELREWLVENVLRPCGLFFVENADGKITVDRMWTRLEASQYTTPETIDEDVLISNPRFSVGEPPIGTFIFEMNWNPGADEYKGKVIAHMADGEKRYKDMSRKFELEVATCYSPTIGAGQRTFQGTDVGGVPFLLACYLTTIWDRFGEHPCPIVTCEVPYNRLIDFLPGQTVQFTSSALPDLKSSARGISSAYFQVVENHPQPDRSSVELVLWMIGVHDENHRLLAPAAKIKSWVGAKKYCYIYDDTFADGITYDYDDEAFSVGDEIMLVDSQYRKIGGGGGAPEEFTIVSIGEDGTGRYIEIDAVPTNVPGDGDYLVTAPYGSATTTQKADWAFLADANDVLGAADDEGHQRS